MFSSKIASRAISIRLLVALTFTAASFPAIGLSASIVGPVISILDGDTIEVLHNTRPERIRLSGIDCPEKGQAYGARAKQAASELVYGKEVTLETFGKDMYGRTLAVVLLPDGTNVNHALMTKHRSVKDDPVVCLRLSRRGEALALQIEQQIHQLEAALTELERRALGMNPKGSRA